MRAFIRGLLIFILLFIAIGALRGVMAACGPYMPWDTVGQATCAPLDELPRIPADGRARDYRVLDNDGLRWGYVERQPGGDFRQWDSRSGYRWGYIEE